MCKKVAHLSEGDAVPHADSLEDLTGVRPNIYQCSICNFWHVGYSAALVAKMPRRSQRHYRYVHRDNRRGR